MDPVSGFSLAVNVIALVDFTAKVISKSNEAYAAANGSTTEITELRSVTERLAQLNNDVHRTIETRREGGRELSDIELRQEKIGLQCQEVAAELLEVLNSLTTRSGHPRWDSIRHAILTLWNKDKIESLEKRIDRFRQDLITTTLAALRHEIVASKKLQFLVHDSVEDMQRRFESIGEIFLQEVQDSHRWREDFMQAIRDNHDSAVQQGGYRTGVSSGFFPNERYLAQEKAVKERLLHRLGYYGMRERHDRILGAYGRTFEWLFRDTYEAQEKWASFSDWLSGGQQLYWITGKPGAGKSTLMKYLYHDSRKLRLLQAWADGTPLVMVAFFFWNSGESIQMSRSGLLRSLIFDVISQFPELIPHVFPERWEIFRLFGEDRSPFDEHSLERAFKLMLASCTASKKICLFIDGLDELEGDHGTLVEMVKEMTKVPRVKVCVSSRPWPVFQETFLSEPSLMLQDLTFRDIELYATERLERNSGFRDLRDEDPVYSQELVSTITRKSSGVFLWVRLVVESLLEGLTDGDRVRDLQKRLEDLPGDLEKLFVKMLDSVEERYKGHASQIFQLHRAACTPPTLLFLSLADEDNARFAMDLETRPLDERTLDARCRRMKRCLASRCKGFLEIAPDIQGGLPQFQALRPSSVTAGTETPPFPINTKVGTGNVSVIEPASSVHTAKHEGNRRVEYLHRTVKDFFAMKEIWLTVTCGTSKDFIPSRRLCAATVAQIKITPPWSLTTDLIWDLTTSALEYALESEARFGQPEVQLLDELNLTLTDLTNVPSENGCTFLRKHLDNVPFQGHWTHTRFAWHTSAPFLHLAAMCGLSLYIKQKLQPDFTMIKEENKDEFTSLLYSATCSGVFSYYVDKPLCSRTTPHLPTIRLLLENGADPHQVRRGMSPWMNVSTMAWRKAVSEQDRNGWLDVIEAFGGQRIQLDESMPRDCLPPTKQLPTTDSSASQPKTGIRRANVKFLLQKGHQILRSGMAKARRVVMPATRTESTEPSESMHPLPPAPPLSRTILFNHSTGSLDDQHFRRKRLIWDNSSREDIIDDAQVCCGSDRGLSERMTDFQFEDYGSEFSSLSNISLEDQDHGFVSTSKSLEVRNQLVDSGDLRRALTTENIDSLNDSQDMAETRYARAVRSIVY